MAALILKQIERGTVTFATADVTKTVTLATTLADTSKTVLLFSLSCTSSNPIDYQVLGYVVSTTQIQFERQATPGNAATVEYQVIEFLQGIKVQHIYVDTPTSPENVTITAVDLAKAFPIISFDITGSTFGTDDNWTAEITTTTNLLLSAGGDTTGDDMAVQIVEIDDASVQVIKGTTGTGATADLTVTTITENKTFWFFSMLTTAALTFDALPYLSYVNSTTLRFTREDTTSVNFTYVVYVVSLSAGVTVQNINTVIASGNTTVSPTISSVIVRDTALLLNGIYQRFAEINAANDDAGGNAFELDSLTSTSFTATRAESPALAATTNVQVLNWIGYPSSINLIQE